MQPESIALLQRIDNDVGQILQKFEDIFEVVINADKPREVLAVESLTMESDASVITRLCQDLLNVSRSLKETWVLGTLKVDEGSGADEVHASEHVFNQFNKLTDEIAKKNSKKASIVVGDQ